MLSGRRMKVGAVGVLGYLVICIGKYLIDIICSELANFSVKNPIPTHLVFRGIYFWFYQP